jgi:glycogen debranching enzyme
VIGRYTVPTPIGPVRLATDERLVRIEPCRVVLPSHREDPLRVLLRMAGVNRPGELGDGGPLIASLANPENAANPELRHYEAVFGRDALYSAAFLADLYPKLEAETVRFLAGFQASKHDPFALAVPGKIPNHIRDSDDPLARKLTAETGRHWPWFGGTDTTVLFAIAASRVIDRDAGALDWPIAGGRTVRDATAAAGRWLLGELRQDLLWVYLNRKDSYTVWTDSPNAFHHADGTLASPPVAPVQLQAEVHDALCGLARHAAALRLPGDTLNECARRIRTCLRTAFIVDHPRGPFLAAALSARGEPLAVRTVGMGMALDSAALDGHDIIRRIADHLFSPQMLTPFGVAGRASDEVRFEPFDYHSQVWAVAVHRTARGLARHGHPDLARELDQRVLQQTRDGLFPENVGAYPDLRYCPHILTVARPAPDGRPTVTVKERPPAPYAAWTVAAVLAIHGEHAVKSYRANADKPGAV